MQEKVVDTSQEKGSVMKKYRQLAFLECSTNGRLRASATVVWRASLVR